MPLHSVLKSLRGLGTGMILILILSILLLVSDCERMKIQSDHIRIAMIKISSRTGMDLTIKGYIDGLRKRGYVDGKNIIITQYNAENDLPTANTIASEIINKRYDMVMTTSTPILQVMANANRDGDIIHVFGAVTDPFTAGVGIDPKDQFNRPGHLAGLGTFQPVEMAFIIAKQMYPDLDIVGTAWNPGEASSSACLVKARKICDSLNITLLENTINSSTEVFQASQALISRGAQALWTGGDNTVELAIDIVVKAANAANIPVFANNPSLPANGALFGLGANYYQVGLAVADIAAGILDGKDPRSFPIKDVAPEFLVINNEVLKDLKDPWMINEDLKNKADSIIYN